MAGLCPERVGRIPRRYEAEIRPQGGCVGIASRRVLEIAQERVGREVMPGLIVQSRLCLREMPFQRRQSGYEQIAGSDATACEKAMVDAIQVRRQTHCCRCSRLRAREDNPSACQLTVVGIQIDSDRRTPAPDGNR